MVLIPTEIKLFTQPSVPVTVALPAGVTRTDGKAGPLIFSTTNWAKAQVVDIAIKAATAPETETILTFVASSSDSNYEGLEATSRYTTGNYADAPPTAFGATRYYSYRWGG